MHTATPIRQAACALQPDSAPLHIFHSDKPTLAAGRFVSQQNTPNRERRARRVQFIEGVRQRRAVQLRQLQATGLIPSGSAAQTCHFHAANQHQRQHGTSDKGKEQDIAAPHSDHFLLL